MHKNFYAPVVICGIALENGLTAAEKAAKIVNKFGSIPAIVEGFQMVANNAPSQDLLDVIDQTVTLLPAADQQMFALRAGVRTQFNQYDAVNRLVADYEATYGRDDISRVVKINTLMVIGYEANREEIDQLLSEVTESAG